MLKKLALVVYLLSTQAPAAELWTEVLEWDVRFTNPICQAYNYSTAATARDGSPLVAKPKNAFCKASDEDAALANPQGPYSKFIDWIKDPQTKEILLIYFSFMHKGLKNELCTAIHDRQVKLIIILDLKADQKDANFLISCAQQSNQVQLHLRGRTQDITFAHNKIALINPNSEKDMRIVFGSANLSLGFSLHHENWNFIRIPSNTYFAQVHLCLREGLLNHAESIPQFSKFIEDCRKQIPFAAETDVDIFLVPGEGQLAEKALQEAMQKSEFVDIAAHRFSNKAIADGIRRRLQNAQTTRLVADDDLFWVRNRNIATSRNTSNEGRLTAELMTLGLKTHFMETNHSIFQLHHNKFLIFYGANYNAVFAGAGNLTNAAFRNNFENYYLIRIPQIVERYRQQYTYLWKTSTEANKLPKSNVLP